MTRPPRQYNLRESLLPERQKFLLERYEASVIRRAERAGDETTIVKVAHLRWLWDLAYRAPPPRHREGSTTARYRQEEELGKALATSWVRVERGMSKAQAKDTMYATIRSVLSLAESTAERWMDNREVRQIARGFIDPDVTDDERAEFWSQFDNLTEVDRRTICERINRRRGSR